MIIKFLAQKGIFLCIKRTPRKIHIIFLKHKIYKNTL